MRSLGGREHRKLRQFLGRKKGWGACAAHPIVELYLLAGLEDENEAIWIRFFIRFETTRHDLPNACGEHQWAELLKLLAAVLLHRRLEVVEALSGPVTTLGLDIEFIALALQLGDLGLAFLHRGVIGFLGEISSKQKLRCLRHLRVGLNYVFVYPLALLGGV